LKKGIVQGARDFTASGLRYMLRNRFYVGELVDEDQIIKGTHSAIIDRGLFDVVQRRLTHQRYGLTMGTPATFWRTELKLPLSSGER
jgi:hypothetical protein